MYWLYQIDLRYVGSIQKYMSCKGGCLASVGTDQPAEVVYDSPKYMVMIVLWFKKKQTCWILDIDK